MNIDELEELDRIDIENIEGGSVISGVGVLGTTVVACSSILGSGPSLMLGVGLVTACAPAAVVVAVAGAAIGGAIISQGIVNKNLV